MRKLNFLLLGCILNYSLFGLHGQTINRTYTTLSGFYDYQSNGNVNQYIRVNPVNGNIHAVYMTAGDSTAAGFSNSRRTGYAFSSNGGNTWNNFNNLNVPSIRSGYPSMDLMRTVCPGAPVITNHTSSIGLYIDCPEGGGVFSELSQVPPPFSPQPLWPEVAATADGSQIIVGSMNNAGCETYVWRPGNSPSQLQGGCSGTYVAQASYSDSGRVGVALLADQTASIGVGIYFYESTNNGFTWPNLPTRILPSNFVVGADSFRVSSSVDFTYEQHDPIMSFAVLQTNSGLGDGAGIGFWSSSTGFVVAVPHSSIPNVSVALNKPQRNHLTVGYPAIAMSGQNIVIAFQAFMSDTSAKGFNYSEVFFTVSSNGGSSWTLPQNLSNTQFMDERYPSISKFNAANQANLVWQEDPSPGQSVLGDGSDTARTRQVFCRILNITSSAVESNNSPQLFSLAQNYPNPFNPTTKIEYRIVNFGFISLKVFDLLGREVATLVNEEMTPGSYERTFTADGLASGVYLCRLHSRGFVQTKKLLLLR